MIEALAALPESDQNQLAQQFLAEIEACLQTPKTFDEVVESARSQYAAGQTMSMEEFFERAQTLKNRQA